jgi:hypothetical protein
MSAAQAARKQATNVTTAKTVNHPRVLRQHRVAVPGRRGTDGYRREFADIAKGFALLGANYAAIADLFGVHVDTVSDWKKAHPGFRRALDEGSKYADGLVAHAFYRRCIGLTIVNKTREVRTAYDTGGNVTGTAEITITETRELPPDPLACWRWLQRRQRWGLDEPEVTTEDILRVAEAARKEAARRGISFRSAIPLVQQEHREWHIPRCPHCNGLWLEASIEQAEAEAEAAAAAGEDEENAVSRLHEAAGKPDIAGPEAIGRIGLAGGLRDRWAAFRSGTAQKPIQPPTGLWRALRGRAAQRVRRGTRHHRLVVTHRKIFSAAVRHPSSVVPLRSLLARPLRLQARLKRLSTFENSGLVVARA